MDVYSVHHQPISSYARPTYLSDQYLTQALQDNLTFTAFVIFYSYFLFLITH